MYRMYNIVHRYEWSSFDAEISGLIIIAISIYIEVSYISPRLESAIEELKIATAVSFQHALHRMHAHMCTRHVHTIHNTQKHAQHTHAHMHTNPPKTHTHTRTYLYTIYECIIYSLIVSNFCNAECGLQ